jgi:hypothetical protein
MKDLKTKEIQVIIGGINQLGVDETNEFYKKNIELGYFKPIKLGEMLVSNKRFKNSKSFYDKGLENYVGTYDCTQYKEAWHGVGYGPRFSFQLKHFNIKIYEVNITETYDEVTL